MERERLQNYVGNGDKAVPTFSDAEMQRRLDGIRGHMAKAGIDAALFTSYHCINYYSDFLFCYFGRRYGFLVDHNIATSISAGIDGGQPWRRTFGGKNVTYTDWQKDNYFHAIRGLTGGVKRLGIEFDHINIDTLNLLKSEFPHMEFVDIGAASMRLRMIKSPEEIAHITKMTRIADIGGAACVTGCTPGTGVGGDAATTDRISTIAQPSMNICAPICSAILFTAVRGSGGRPIVRASSADSCAMRSDRSTAALAGAGSFGGKAASLSPAVAGSSKREPAGRKAPPALPESLRAAAVRAARSVASASLSPPSMSLRLYSCSLNSFGI